MAAPVSVSGDCQVARPLRGRAKLQVVCPRDGTHGPPESLVRRCFRPSFFPLACAAGSGDSVAMRPGEMTGVIGVSYGCNSASGAAVF